MLNSKNLLILVHPFHLAIPEILMDLSFSSFAIGYFPGLLIPDFEFVIASESQEFRRMCFFTEERNHFEGMIPVRIFYSCVRFIS